MRVINTSVNTLSTRYLVIGFEGENERTQIRIDAASVFDEYPQASPSMAVKPGFGEEVYPVIVTKEGNEVVWDVTQDNLDFTGDGEIQLTFIKDNVICKTTIGKIRVNRSLIVNGDPPEHIDTWYDEATAKLADVDEAVNALEAIDAIASGLPAGSDPTVTLRYVEALGHKRFTFQIPKGDRGDRGATGNGIRSISQSGSTGLYKKYTIHFTDGTTTTFQVRDGDRGLKGDTGATPDISIGTVQTLPAGSEAIASMSGTAEEPLLNLGIPKGDTGEKGDKGDKGDRGATPVFSMGAVTNLPAGTSATATITGTAEEPVLNLGIPKGDKGDKGDRGERGPQGIQGIQGDRGLTGPKGVKGDRGDKGDTGATGATGATPDFSIGTVSTLPAGSSATAEITGTAENPVLSLGIPQGAQGIQGVQGEKGEKGDTGEVTTEQMDAAIDEALQDYARTDGYYPDMTVGNAEQLNSSKFVENSEPYTFRTSGGTSDIGNREYLDAVVGGTVAWNQMVRDEASENSTDFADVVTVTDAVEDNAGVRVKLEPVQDLHGYDHPWPAGGGANVFDALTWITLGANSSNYSVSSDETITVLQNDAGGISNRLFSLTAGDTYSALVTGNIATIKVYDSASGTIATGGSLTFTVPADGKIAVKFTAASYPSSGKCIIVKGSTVPSAWTPYSNICPITGWTGTEITRTGVNLWDEEWEVGAISLSTGQNVDATNRIRSKNYIPVKPGMTLCLNLPWVNINAYDANKAYVAGNQSNNQPPLYVPSCTDDNKPHPRTWTVPDGVWYLRFHVTTTYGTEYKNDSGINYPATDTTYHAFTGATTIPITLPTEAGTVYGGELTVNADGSGSLVVDRASVTIPQRATAVTQLTNTTRFMIIRLLYPDWYKIRADIISNMFVEKGYNTDVPSFSHGDNSANVYFKVPKSLGLTTGDEINAWLENNPIQLVYPLETPITYTLSASEIRTLLGTNNIWADTGDLALTYTGTDEHLVLESGKKYLSRISGTDSMLLGSGQEITAAKGTDNVFDLTQMFGSAVADYVYGQGAAFFRKWFPNARYPYNAGELRSVEGLESHDCVGFNLFDEKQDGQIISAYRVIDFPAGLLGKCYMELSDNDTSVQLPSNLCVGFVSKKYDGTHALDQSEFRWVLLDGAIRTNHSNTNGSTSPSDGDTLLDGILIYPKEINVWRNVLRRYKICINLSHSGARNGEYEPYEKHSYPLDTSVILRGIPKVGANGVYWDGDRYLPDGTVERRYGEFVIDGNAVSLIGTSSVGIKYASGNISPYGKDVTANKIVSGNYSASASGTVDKSVRTIGGTFYVYNNEFESLDDAKSKLNASPILVVYELATPTTETAQPYHSTQWVSDWGTEEFVSTGIVPVGHETRYPANLRDKLQHLPDAASGNGSYLITQTDGQMVLTPFPAPPSTAGNYVLKATVVNGVATYTWEVET